MTELLKENWEPAVGRCEICAAAIGDGDYVSGHRLCRICRDGGIENGVTIDVATASTVLSMADEARVLALNHPDDDQGPTVLALGAIVLQRMCPAIARSAHRDGEPLTQDELAAFSEIDDSVRETLRDMLAEVEEGADPDE